MSLLKIFLVEDSHLLRSRLRSMLAAIDGAAVVGDADNETAALAGILEQQPDVVVLDLYLASGNGLEVLRQVKQARPEISVIILTNHGEPQYRERCLHLKADYFFDKTKHINDFLIVVKEMVDSAQLAMP